jgi:hypothetical protein
MTLHARSDLMGVAVSKDHGGCGATHSRPVTHGSPVKVWVLDCHACENHLRGDPNWAVDPEEIPETPDEMRLRENQEKRGEKNIASSLQASIASLASSQEGMQKLMAIMTTALAGLNPEVTKALTALTGASPEEPPVGATRDNPTGVASPSRTRVNVIEAERAELVDNLLEDDATPVEPDDDDNEPVQDLSKLTVKDLRQVARDRGLADSGTRAVLIERLTQAG